VQFATATQWVAKLSDAKRQGQLEAELKRLALIPLLIVDEIGYIQFDPALSERGRRFRENARGNRNADYAFTESRSRKHGMRPSRARRGLPERDHIRWFTRLARKMCLAGHPETVTSQTRTATRRRVSW
jgi:hypothetical protein